MVLQNKRSNYDTDIFKPLIDKLEEISNFKYIASSNDSTSEIIDISFRVIVDHIRAVAFSITDGQLPTNTGAGYVIRRILRRAIRYGYQFLDFKEPFLYQLIPVLAQNFDGVFDELQKQEEFIVKIVKEEEASFFRTLSGGIKKMQEIIKNYVKSNSIKISGHVP